MPGGAGDLDDDAVLERWKPRNFSAATPPKRPGVLPTGEQGATDERLRAVWPRAETPAAAR
jgi:hypothetical protein